MKESATVARKCAAEIVGTFVLVFFGVGAVPAAVPTGARQGIRQVAVGRLQAMLAEGLGAVLGATVYQCLVAQALSPVDSVPEASISQYGEPLR